jgi:hypothetical protein
MKESKGFNAATGTSSEGFSRGTNKLSGNHYMKTNSDALINKGRGPTIGNKSDKDSTYPGADATKKFVPGKDMFMGCHSPQVRTPGGTKAMPATGKESFNYGRGPTKGNQL